MMDKDTEKKLGQALRKLKSLYSSRDKCIRERAECWETLKSADAKISTYDLNTLHEVQHLEKRLGFLYQEQDTNDEKFRDFVNQEIHIREKLHNEIRDFAEKYSGGDWGQRNEAWDAIQLSNSMQDDLEKTMLGREY